MEFSIKTLVIFFLILITAIIIVLLIMSVNSESGNLLEGLFGIFNNLVSG